MRGQWTRLRAFSGLRGGGQGLVLLMVWCLAACAPTPIVPKNHLPPAVRGPGQVLSYNTVVQRHNARIERLGRLWARTDVKFRWIEEDGARRSEQGGGKLIVVRDANGPGLHGVALTVGKLGQTVLWAGTDGERYWVFDLHGEKVVRFGTVGQDEVILEGGVPPEAVPLLLGLLPVEPVVPDRPVEVVAGYLVLRPSANAAMFVHPRTGLPSRVILLDRGGDEALASHLERYRPVAVKGLARDDRPLAPTRVDLYARAAPLHAAVRLSGMTDQRIKPAVFDFDALLETHRPTHLVDLDQTVSTRLTP